MNKKLSLTELSPIRDISHLTSIIIKNPFDERLNIENKLVNIFDVFYLRDYIRIDIYNIDDRKYDTIYLYNNTKLFIREYNEIRETVEEHFKSKLPVKIRFINSYKLQNVLINI